MTVIIDRQKLIQARYAKGLGHKELAKLAGVSHVTIMNAEKGCRTTLPGSLLKICDALDLGIDEVIEIIA